jgi:transmembrane sensor
MSSLPPDSSDDALRAEAARWTVRRDRGLSAAESIEYELWIAADERHAAAMQRSAAAWSLLDRLPDSAATPVLAAAVRRRTFWQRTLLAGSFAAAAALAVVGYLALRAPTAEPAASVATAATAGPRQLTLSDGTVVQLNTGGEVVEQFSPAERRVLLSRGEAHFAVTKNPARPFVVQAGSLRVRAVGTAFNVNLQSAQIEVLVTEGRVQLSTGTPASSPEPTPALPPAPEAPLVEAGHRAVVPGRAADPFEAARGIVVSRIDADDLARALAWQAPLLRFGGATLAELALEFERHSGRRVILADPSLAGLRVGGRFRADDVDGFAHLLATTFDLEVERAADGTLVLRKKKAESR